MPCTYTSVKLQEKNQERQRKKAKADRKAEISRKKKALLTALNILGFDLEIQSLGDGKTLINGRQD